jgi:cell division protein FtsI/penicillin-binding protein 2
LLQTNKRELINNGYNTETKLLSRSVIRGTIYDADETILARTTRKSPAEELREYPYEREYAHIVGYAIKGLLGIEKCSNYDLMHASIPLSEQIEHAKNREPSPGNNVYTTLQIDIQNAAFEAFEGQKGCIIVTEVSTGKVLAMVSAPDFDPASIDDNWDVLMEDEENSELINRCIYGLYALYDPFETAYDVAAHEKELNSCLYDFELGIATCKQGPEGDYLITPMHMHMLACASANGGETCLPFVVERVENADRKVLSEKTTGKRVVLTTAEEAVSIRAALNVQDDELTSTSWYTGFSSEDDPANGIAVTVLVENCSGHRDLGEKICKKILKAYTR